MFDTTSTNPPIVISGRREELDAAQVWVRAVLHSALGPEAGEAHYRAIPTLPVLLAYRALMDTSEVH